MKAKKDSLDQERERTEKQICEMDGNESIKGCKEKIAQEKNTNEDFYIMNEEYQNYKKNFVGNIEYDPNARLFTFHKTPQTWSSAEDTCVSQGGHLVSILSEAEQLAVTNMDKGNIWLGGRRIKVNENISTWEWVDGSKWEYTKWGQDEGTAPCLYMWDGGKTWFDDVCNKEYVFVCVSKVMGKLLAIIIKNKAC